MASKDGSPRFGTALAKLLRSIADQVELLPDESLVAIVEGNADIELGLSRVKPSAGVGRELAEPTTARTSGDDQSLGQLEARLRECQTRDEGLRLLEEAFSTKRALQRFARHVDVSVQKHDTTEALRDKIVATTIGYRLRSAAIRGDS